MSVRFTTAGAAAAAVAAVELLSRDAPVHGGMTKVRTLVALDSTARGSSSIGRASVVEVGDGRAASGAVFLGGGEVTVSVRLTTAVAAADADAAGAVAAVELLSRDAPAHGGIK